MKFLEILKKNEILKKKLKGDTLKIKIVSNITLNQIKEIGEYYFNIRNIKTEFKIVSNENIISEIISKKKNDIIIIFWEISNLIEGYEINNLISKKRELKKVEKNLESQIDLINNKLRKSKLVIFNKFSISQFYNHIHYDTKLDYTIKKINIYLEKNKNANTEIIDLDNVFKQVGIQKSIDLLKFETVKSLYTLDFFSSYINFIGPTILSNLGKLKKVIVFDFDKTLWPGIIGEDISDDSTIEKKLFENKIFNKIYNLINYFYDNGILLCINSKNNYEDVINFVNKTKLYKINLDKFLIKKINWKNKHENLIEISNELNLNLDSFIFIDDSDFEINLIKDKLPEVMCVKVPDNISQYPYALLNLIPFVIGDIKTSEDKKRNLFYKQDFKRNNIKEKFTDIIDYLRSLNMKIAISINNSISIDRISQMSIKTNQFNLTSKRYTAFEIKNLFNDKNNLIITLSLSDQFGDFGITGLCIIKLSNKNAKIDTFLLSCRIIGRNVEMAFINKIFNILKTYNVQKINSIYYDNTKNKQVENFFENIGFKIYKTNNNTKFYNLKMSDFNPQNIEYIKVLDD